MELPAPLFERRMFCGRCPFPCSEAAIVWSSLDGRPTSHSLAELLAPLQHRLSRMFEVHGIESRWRADDLGRTYLTTTHSLDLLRVLQGALANVLKHSGAKHVDIDLFEKNDVLHLVVSDARIAAGDASRRLLLGVSATDGAIGQYITPGAAQRKLRALSLAFVAKWRPCASGARLTSSHVACQALR